MDFNLNLCFINLVIKYIMILKFLLVIKIYLFIVKKDLNLNLYFNIIFRIFISVV